MRLAEIRKKRGLSQSELAKQIGYSQNMISQWENGSRDPNTQTLIILADFFNITIDYLLGRTSTTNDKLEKLSPKAQLHIKKYLQLSVEGQENVDNTLDFELSKLSRKERAIQNAVI